MLKSLEELRMGVLSPRTFKSEIILQRTLDLELSENVSMVPLHTAGCTALDLDGIEERFLLCGGKNGTIAVYDLANLSGNLKFTTVVLANIRPTVNSHNRSISRVQWYPFDTGLFTTSSKCKSLKIWDANKLVAVDTLHMESWINSHDMSTIASNHNLIAVASYESNITLYDPKGGCSTHQLRGHKRGVECVKWSPNIENLLVSGGRDKKIFLWDVRSAKGYLKSLDQQNGDNYNEPQDAHDDPITALKFTSDGHHLVSRDSNNRMKLWNVATAKNTFVNYSPITVAGSLKTFLPFSLEICNDSSLPVLFMANNCNINVYDLYTGIRHKTLKGHLNRVFCCVFRPSMQELYSGGNDMNILVWSPYGQYEKGLPPHGNNTSAFIDNWSSDDETN